MRKVKSSCLRAYVEIIFVAHPDSAFSNLRTLFHEIQRTVMKVEFVRAKDGQCPEHYERRQVGVGLDCQTHLSAGRPIKHPRWNLQPTVRVGCSQVAAKDNQSVATRRFFFNIALGRGDIVNDIRQGRNRMPSIASPDHGPARPGHQRRLPGARQ
jgi:hypothetical protein